MSARGGFLPNLANRADVVQWADRIEARVGFPRLVRDLILRNNDQLLALQVRTEEGVDLRGYDGFSSAAHATPFVPEGEVVWELGTGEDPQDKANRDFRSRSNNSLGRDKSTTTFAFVTPREWPNKAIWEAKRRGEHIWKDVRAFDVDDIMQAFERAPAVHARFSETIGRVGHGAQSIEDWWTRFRRLSIPPLDPDLVLAGRADSSAQLLRLFESESRVTSITADQRR